MDMEIPEIFNYRHNHESQCDLAIGRFQEGGKTFVVFRERRDNPGVSVTNASETIAGLVWRRRLSGDLQSPEEDVRWFETYNGDFDEITYTWTEGSASDPTWKRVHDPSTISRLRSLLEETLPKGEP